MRTLYLLLLTGLFITGCKSAGSALDRGDYGEAIELSIRKLRKDPSDGEALTILKAAYRKETSRREDRIRQMLSSSNSVNYDRIYSEYAYLQSLYNNIEDLDAAARFVKPQDYSSYLATYEQKAVEHHIEMAEGEISEGTKVALRQAYSHLGNALSYQPKNISLKRWRDSVYEASITNIVILPVDLYGSRPSYSFQGFENELTRLMNYSSANSFYKFYTNWEANNRQVQPDEVMELRLGPIFIGQPQEERNSVERTERVVIKETVYRPDSIIKEYANVKARVNTVNRLVKSGAAIYITVKNARGSVMFQDRVDGLHQWQEEIVSYTGDERALTSDDRKKINRSGNNTMPSEDQVFRELVSDLKNNLKTQLSRYYRY